MIFSILIRLLKALEFTLHILLLFKIKHLSLHVYLNKLRLRHLKCPFSNSKCCKFTKLQKVSSGMKLTFSKFKTRCLKFVNVLNASLLMLVKWKFFRFKVSIFLNSFSICMSTILFSVAAILSLMMKALKKSFNVNI